jgi:LmbE family N-acetylglucosaminyl deacetylase
VAVSVKQSVLVVAAHPDDEVLGCGATLAGLCKSRDIHILVLGEGFTSRYESRDKADRAEVDRLKAAAQAAATILGARSIKLDNLPDNRFDEVSLLDIVKRVEKAVEEARPEIIYTHHPGDLNVDHRITFQAVLTATRPLPGSCVRELYTFEVPSSTEWAFHQLEPSFKPNVFVDVSETIETKIKAMAQYGSEARPFPHPRSPEALRSIARRWGTVVGLESVEAFELVRSIH